MVSCVSPGNTQITLGGNLRSIDCSVRLLLVHPESESHLRMRTSRSALFVENDFNRFSTVEGGTRRKRVSAALFVEREMQTLQKTSVSIICAPRLNLPIDARI